MCIHRVTTSLSFVRRVRVELGHAHLLFHRFSRSRVRASCFAPVDGGCIESEQRKGVYPARDAAADAVDFQRSPIFSHTGSLLA